MGVTRLRNHVAVDTRWGMRHFELFEGDITDAKPVDLLAVSVLGASYAPAAGSTIARLHERFGIDLGQLAQDPELDLTSAFGCWVSREFPVGKTNFRRLLCDVKLGSGRTIREVLVDVFAVLSALEARGSAIRVIAMPLVGTGVQKIAPEEIVEPLVELALEHLERSRHLERVQFIELREDRVDRLSAAMDRHLGRRACGLPEGGYGGRMRSELVGLLLRAADIVPARRGTLAEIERELNQDSAHAAHIFRAGRALAEAITLDIAEQLEKPRERPFELAAQIDWLRQQRVAPWVASYMDLLRVFGNEAVHNREHQREKRRPKDITLHDLELALGTMLRLTEMWLAEWHGTPPSAR